MSTPFGPLPGSIKYGSFSTPSVLCERSAQCNRHAWCACHGNKHLAKLSACGFQKQCTAHCSIELHPLSSMLQTAPYPFPACLCKGALEKSILDELPSFCCGSQPFSHAARLSLIYVVLFAEHTPISALHRHRYHPHNQYVRGLLVLSPHGCGVNHPV